MKICIGPIPTCAMRALVVLWEGWWDNTIRKSLAAHCGLRMMTMILKEIGRQVVWSAFTKAALAQGHDDI